MAEAQALEAFLDGARVDDAVWTLRPDYRAVLLAVDGLTASFGDDGSEALLQRAESSAHQALREQEAEQLPHIAAWREAYRAFGAKPQRTRNSVEALTRRAEAGLPRVNRLTDIYNAVSVLHQLPVGGEDLAMYCGGPQLIRASGDEAFVTTRSGAEVTEHPEPGEVVWCDDAGVTCRRWNWRQATRTQLGEHTTTAFFFLEAWAPMTDAQLTDAADDLTSHLRRLGPDVRLAHRWLSAPLNERGDRTC